ncbi:MAG: c-type cytochrome [Gammaproteobacteria bacterium]
MRRLPILAGLVVFASVAVTALANQPVPAPGSATARKVGYPAIKMPPTGSALAGEVIRGAYLVKISDCMACHTDHDDSGLKAPAFSGGLPMKTPFGIIYSRNITPDKATGIGSWTFEQFDDAVRYGESPHGYLFAAMPYAFYNKMSRDDVHAMWEYLKRVPAVHNPDKPLAMMIPFKWRWLQFGWQFMFFKPGEGPLKPDPNHSAEWNRGRFIVQGPEHCGACHTPHNFLGGTAFRYDLTGSSISGMWAPNVSALATDPHPVPVITEVFSQARGLGGGTLRGPMLDAIQHSMQFMTPADMRAVAVYIRSVNSEMPPTERPVPAKDADLRLGAQVYNGHCAACHDSGAGGAPKVGDPKDWAALEKTPMVILYENMWHGVSLMPPKGGCTACSALELTSAMAYMLKQSQPGVKPASSAAAAKSNVAGNVVSLAVGQQIYQTHCSACHASGAVGAPKYGDNADWAPRIKQGLDALYQHATTGLGAMPPKGGCTACTADEIESAVDYMVSASGGKAEVEKSLKQPSAKGGR